MKKQIWAILVVFIWVMTVPNHAIAAGNTYASAYEWEDTLYIAALIPDMTIGRAQLQIGTGIGRIQGDATAKKQSDIGSPVNLMLLVDCSTSMPNYKSQTISVAESLLSRLKEYSVTVASFGTRFEVNMRNLTDWESVKQTLEKLGQTQRGTDICGGIVQAVQEMKASLWSPGTFSHIILLTDGEPYYTAEENSELEAKQERETAKQLTTLMEQSPQILLHSVSFASWKGTSETSHAITSFGGVHRVAYNDTLAETDGIALADFVTQLNIIKFSMPSEYYTRDLTLIVSSSPTVMRPDSAVRISRSANLNNVETTPINADSIPVISGRESTSIKLPDSQSENPSTNNGIDNTTDGLPVPNLMTPNNSQLDDTQDENESIPDSSSEVDTVPNEETNGTPGESDEESSVNAEDVDDNPGSNDSSEILILPSDGYEDKIIIDEENQEKGFPVLVALLCILGIALALVVAYFLTKKKRRGTPIHVTIYNNGPSGERRTIYMQDELLIGSDSRCDLVIRHKSVASINTRLFTKNQILYIEDMNSPSGTSIEGMRIFTPTVLHSGEDVLIGDVGVQFRVEES